MSTPPTQLSRYKRNSQAFRDHVLTDRDRLILKLLYEHRFMDTELLWHRLRFEYTAQGYLLRFGMSALYKRLQRLFHQGYVARQFLYDQPIGRGRGSVPTVYSIGGRGVATIAAMLGARPAAVRELVERNRVKGPFLRHALGVATFRVVLELACRYSPEHVTLVGWLQGTQLADTVTTEDQHGTQLRHVVYPDAAFALRSEAGKRLLYFLEFDRGTMPLAASAARSDIRSKIIGYWLYRKYGKHRYRYGYTTDAEGRALALICTNSPSPSISPAPGFSVLFIMPGSTTSDGTAAGRIANALKMVQGLDRGIASSSLFWFATPAVLSLSNPEMILGPVWRTVNAASGFKRLASRP